MAAKLRLDDFGVKRILREGAGAIARLSFTLGFRGLSE